MAWLRGHYHTLMWRYAVNRHGRCREWVSRSRRAAGLLVGRGGLQRDEPAPMSTPPHLGRSWPRAQAPLFGSERGFRETAPGNRPTPACRAALTKASPRQGEAASAKRAGAPGALSRSSGPKNSASTACRRARSSRCSAMIVSSRPSSISRVTISAVSAGVLQQSTRSVAAMPLARAALARNHASVAGRVVERSMRPQTGQGRRSRSSRARADWRRGPAAAGARRRA
jgi:hypothetical protein